MRFVFYPVPQKSDGVVVTIWQNFLLRKSGVFDTPKHRSPGRSRKLPEAFPEVVPEGFSSFSCFFALLVPFSLFFLLEAITFLPLFQQKS